MSMFESQMSFAMASGYSHHRPLLTRSRSHTDPTRQETSPEDQAQSTGPNTTYPPSSARPTHTRSKSYLAPTDSKSHSRSILLGAPATAALEKTAEKLPRLHLPGSSHRHHHHSHSHSQQTNSNKNEPYKRHRSTQSEAHPRKYVPKPDKDKLTTSTTLPHLVAGLNAERERRTQAAVNPNGNNNHNNLTTFPSSSPSLQHLQNRDAQRAFGPSDSSYADYIDGGRYDLRRRATSDPNRTPLTQKTSFELLLERGDQTRFAKRLHVKKEDILRRDAEIATAEDEMRQRITEITSSGVEITRRLDYGYYNLLEKVNNLIGTITSFQSLSTQTGQLIHNFDKETHRLDTDTRHRVDTFKETFAAREQKASALTERGTKASRRAEDLSQRLENARTILENWEQREASSQRAWNRASTAVWYTVLTLAFLFLSLVLAKEWWFRGDPVKAGLRLHGEGSWNKSLRLGASGESGPAAENERMVLASESLPIEVKSILQGIAERNRQRKVVFPEVPRELLEDEHGREDGEEGEDPRLKTFDEL